MSVIPSPAISLLPYHQAPNHPENTTGRLSSGEDSASEVVEVVLPQVAPDPIVPSLESTILNGKDEQPSAPKPTKQQLHKPTTSSKRPIMTMPELPPKKKSRSEHMEKENGTLDNVKPQDVPGMSINVPASSIHQAPPF